MLRVSGRGPSGTCGKDWLFPAVLVSALQQCHADEPKSVRTKKKAIRLGIALESTGVVLGGDKQEKQ
jgi:hypothetical protein